MTDYTQSFLATWKIYPKRNGQKRGKSQSFVEWEKLTVEEQREAYRDIKARNNAQGWEYVRDMERYLKRREWEDEWSGADLKSDPDLLSIKPVDVGDLCDYATEHLPLCEHQIQRPWTYFGPAPGQFRGAVIPACGPCSKPSQRVRSSEIPA